MFFNTILVLKVKGTNVRYTAKNIWSEVLTWESLKSLLKYHVNKLNGQLNLIIK